MNMLAFGLSAGRITLSQKPADRLTWLENAVTISLFTDARVSPDETDDSSDLRGYWGDMDLPEGQSLGSKLWTLRREKITQDVLNKTHDYCVDALAWLVEGDHLQAVNVTVRRGGLHRIEFTIHCQLPDGSWIELLREHQHAV